MVLQVLHFPRESAIIQSAIIRAATLPRVVREKRLLDSLCITPRNSSSIRNKLQK